MFDKLKFILSAFFLAEFGRTMYFVVVTWILYSMTNDPMYTGLLVGMGFVPGLVFNLIFGVLVDRFNRKRLTLIAILINTLAVSVLLISLATNSLHVWIIIGVHMVLQLMGSLFRPSIQAFIAEVFEKKKLPKIFSQTGSIAIVGSLLGASTGGIITGLASEFISIIIVVLSYSLAFISLLLIKVNNQVKIIPTTKGSIISDLIGGFIYLKNNRYLLGLFGTMFVGQLTFHTSLGFLSVYTKAFLNHSTTVYGFLDSSLSIGGVIAGILGTWWWNKSANYISTRSLLIVGVGLLLLGTTAFLPVVFFGVFLIGLGTTWVRVLLQSVQQIATDKQYHGRMASYRMLCNQGSVVISAPLLGWVAASLGANSVYLALMVPVGLAAILTLKQAQQSYFKEITQKKST